MLKAGVDEFIFEIYAHTKQFQDSYSVDLSKYKGRFKYVLDQSNCVSLLSWYCFPMTLSRQFYHTVTQILLYLSEFLFKDRSTLVGNFVSQKKEEKGQKSQ